MNFFRKLANWYFRRNSLPYWSILTLDLLILLMSGIVSYWIFTNWTVVTTHMVPLVSSLLVYVALSIIGIRYFHTYAGIVRYSSFIDLMRVAYANMLSTALALGAHYLLFSAPDSLFLPITGRQIVLMFIIATFTMWSMRVLVKTVYDVSTADNQALRVLIYGAQSGGVGLAESIRTQTPRRFVLKGFISHNRRLRHNELVGEKVREWGEECMDESGYSEVGAVVGATYPEMGKRLREIMPKSYILVPGYGAQGGKGKDLVHFFNEDGLGAIVNSSRGIIAAWKQEKYAGFGPEAYADAARQAVLDMKEDISEAIGK